MLLLILNHAANNNLYKPITMNERKTILSNSKYWDQNNINQAQKNKLYKYNNGTTWGS